jgi:hypothetical protein
MVKRNRLLFPGLLLAGLFLGLTLLHGSVMPVQASTPASVSTGTGYIVLAWNDLGMHCYNTDFQDLAILPPFNTLWAQVVKVGDPPQLVTTGIDVTYTFPDNSESATKTNFWTYAQALFGLPSPLPANIGLKGKGLSGAMDLDTDHFIAAGIPLTEYSDSAPSVQNFYQLAQITVKDSTSSAVLAQVQVVAPVSSELHCENCHDDGGDATTSGGITPTGKVTTNILALHDKLSQADYPASHPAALMDSRPVLCAGCHSDNALGAPGMTGVSSLSNAMHTRHTGLDDITPDTQGCYNCHPGPATQCLRDVMSQQYGMTCISCHGDIAHVATNPDPWLNEPRCDTCHGINSRQNQPLYRFSSDHGGIYCEACHDSTHAIAPSREANDALKFIALQGHPGTLSDCGVCHLTLPMGTFMHGTAVNPFKIFMPFVNQ